MSSSKHKPQVDAFQRELEKHSVTLASSRVPKNVDHRQSKVDDFAIALEKSSKQLEQQPVIQEPVLTQPIPAKTPVNTPASGSRDRITGQQWTTARTSRTPSQGQGSRSSQMLKSQNVGFGSHPAVRTSQKLSPSNGPLLGQAKRALRNSGILDRGSFSSEIAKASQFSMKNRSDSGSLDHSKKVTFSGHQSLSQYTYDPGSPPVDGLSQRLSGTQGIPPNESRMSGTMGRKSGEKSRVSGKMGRMSGGVGRMSGELGRISSVVGRASGKMGRVSGDKSRISGGMGQNSRKISRVSGGMGQISGEIDQVSGEIGRNSGEMGRMSGEMGLVSGEVGQVLGEVGRPSGKIGPVSGDISRMSGSRPSGGVERTSGVARGSVISVKGPHSKTDDSQLSGGGEPPGFAPQRTSVTQRRRSDDPLRSSSEGRNGIASSFSRSLRGNPSDICEPYNGGLKCKRKPSHICSLNSCKMSRHRRAMRRCLEECNEDGAHSDGCMDEWRQDSSLISVTNWDIEILEKLRIRWELWNIDKKDNGVSCAVQIAAKHHKNARFHTP